MTLMLDCKGLKKSLLPTSTPPLIVCYYSTINEDQLQDDISNLYKSLLFCC